ncbi:MAG: DUF4203 domain-containing protein [Actinobacteria bacterium]|nr:DUF4203 domain-containing protein [Actinomycetota bacterium]
MTGQDVIIAVLAIVVGAMFCFRGAIAMRMVITLWGAFTGFMIGASVAAGSQGDRFLHTAVGWIAGWICGLVLGALAYLFYEAAVVMAMAAIGFSLGTTIMVAFGVHWSWLVIGVGVAAGLLLAIIAVASDLPLVILAVLSAFGGASVIVAGIMVLTGTIRSGHFTVEKVTRHLEQVWWWDALYLGLAIAGMIVQFRFIDSFRRSTREHWHAAQRA